MHNRAGQRGPDDMHKLAHRIGAGARQLAAHLGVIWRSSDCCVIFANSTLHTAQSEQEVEIMILRSVLCQGA